MSTKHTPGPWRLNFRYSAAMDSEWFDGVVDPDGARICVDGLALSGGAEARANAHLIAAAPDLLRELQFASQFVLAGGGKSVDLDRIAALIERAGGEQ